MLQLEMRKHDNAEFSKVMKIIKIKMQKIIKRKKRMDNSHTGLPVFMLVRSVGFACLVYILGNLREYLRASKNRNLPAINFSPASNFSAVIFRETDENNKVQLYG